jgi:ABC-type nitrate/sulfonate/bicarbonate transport system permease component
MVSTTNRAVLFATSLTAIAAAIALWQWAHVRDPELFPGPVDVGRAAREMHDEGRLWPAIRVSLRRVFSGWLLGSLIAVPLGVLAGGSRIARAALDPFIHFFRFVPALALTSLFILWFGIGEASKVNLIAYATAFTVLITTASGASSINPDKINGARTLGANRIEMFFQVVLPATVPAIFTGMRLGLANAFLVIVAAEALATQNGIGFLIWNARTYFRTDYIFVGVLCFGLLGFTADRLWRLIGRTVLRRYLTAAGDY